MFIMPIIIFRMGTLYYILYNCFIKSYFPASSNELILILFLKVRQIQNGNQFAYFFVILGKFVTVTYHNYSSKLSIDTATYPQRL